MPSPQVLQPVLKMKVDELFHNWLSDPATQSLLKDYLDLIKSGQHIDLSSGDAQDKRSLTFNENNNVASQRNLAEKKPTSLSTPSSPPSTSTLPSGSSSNTRVTGPNGRILRRSVSTKKAQVRTEEPVTTALSESIPKFHFPQGRPQANLNIDSLISKIEKIFSQFPNERATIEDMGQVAKACECPFYWKMPLFCSAGGDRTGFVSVHKFVAMWRKTLQTCHDDASKFVHLLAKPGCNYLEQDDFIPFLQVVAAAHPGRGLDLALRNGKIALAGVVRTGLNFWTALLRQCFFMWRRTYSGMLLLASNIVVGSILKRDVPLVQDSAEINGDGNGSHVVHKL